MALLVCVANGKGQQASAQPQEPRLRCHQRGIRLEGTLVRQWFYGPPGFGETPKRDARDEVFVLKLTHSITVVAPPNPTKDETCEDELEHVSKVQVWALREHQKEVQEKTGKVVSITGTLDEDPVPGSHLNVQITPESIEEK